MPSSVASQGIYGKNKVQYAELDWYEVEGKYVKLYYYAEEKELACRAFAVAESVSAALSDTLRHELTKTVPLVLYSSQRDFQHSNVVPFLLPEEVAGLTEFAKGRVLVPYTGSEYRFRWVLAHELTHAFVLDKISATLAREKRPLAYFPPLWLQEGLAEYMSALPLPATEAVLRDAVMSEQLVGIDEMWKISGSIMVYREGQSLVTYLAEKFGFGKIVELLEGWGSERTFDALLSKTLGVPVRELSEDWLRSLKEEYYPSVADRDWATSFAEEVSTGGRFNLMPVWTRLMSGEEVLVYITIQGETAELRMRELAGTRSRTIVRAGTSPHFESLHLFRSRLSVSEDGVLAFSSQKGGRDVIHLFDVDKRRRIFTVGLPGLIAISSPALSPDGRSVAFSGQDASGQGDLYVVSLEGTSLVRLTNDGFDERDPDWSPDGNTIVFSSDRCAAGDSGKYQLLTVCPATGVMTALTRGQSSDTDARYSPSGRFIAFVSDRDGVPDIYLMDNTDASVAQVTRSMAGVQMPCWAEDDTTLYFVALSSGEYGMYSMRIPYETLEWVGSRAAPQIRAIAADTMQTPGLFELAAAAADSTPPYGDLKDAELPPIPPLLNRPGDGLKVRESLLGAAAVKAACDTLSRLSRPYRVRFGLDFARTTLAYDPEFLSGSAGQVALSDILGNKHILIHVSSQSEQGGSLLGTLSVGTVYLDLTRRVSYGVGAFSLGTVYDEELGIVREERRDGALLYAAYPMSRFERIEGNVVARLAHEYPYRSGETARAFLLSNYFSYVWDNTNLGASSELIGTRVNLTLGMTRDITRGLADYVIALADLRKSVALSRNAVIASRLDVRSSFGQEGRRFYLGGPSTLRGYSMRTVSGKRVLLLNNELRLPLLARIVLRTPGGALPLPTIRGALFFDAAAGGERELEDWKGSLGFGLYLGGGYFPAVRFNVAWRTDFESITPKAVREFTIGWNY